MRKPASSTLFDGYRRLQVSSSLRLRHLQPAWLSVASNQRRSVRSEIARVPSFPRRAAAGCQRRFFFFSSWQSKRGPLFAIAGLDQPQDFPRLASRAINAAQEELSAVPRHDPAALVKALDNASNGLCRIADAAELCRHVHPDKQFVEHAHEAVNSISAYMGEVNLDSDMYANIRKAEESEAFDALSFEERRTLQHMCRSMESEGVHLHAEDKDELMQLMEKEQQLAFDIVQRQEVLRRGAASSGSVWVPVQHVREALGAKFDALPKRRLDEEEVLLPADPMWTEHILKTTPNSSTRRLVMEAQQSPDDQGEEQMVKFLKVRHRLAQVRGYKSWNQYAQRECLLSSPDAVSDFLQSAWERLLPGLCEDLRLLSDEKQRLGLDGGYMLHAWDLPMLLESCKKSSNLDGTVSAYMTYASLMEGVDLIISRLFGLSFVAETPQTGEVWHESVQKYSLREGDRILGILYLDPFVRAGKTVPSAQYTLQGSKMLVNGERQVPIITLVNALPAGQGGLPVSYAVTFMHEMGHALHSLLSETHMQHLSGTRGAVDFVEFPSHLFEHFVLDGDCLQAYASHAKTRKPMPDDVAERYGQIRSGFAHIDAVQQLMYAVIDQAFYNSLHGGRNSENSRTLVREVHRCLAEATAPFDRDIVASGAPIQGSFTAFLGLSRPSKFDHLVHYGGTYYCYLFNRVLSAHIWQEAFKGRPFERATGERLRTLLRQGSVSQSLESIQALCSSGDGVGAAGTAFRAHEVPLDAFIELLGGQASAR